jgi:hypothetical protein
MAARFIFIKHVPARLLQQNTLELFMQDLEQAIRERAYHLWLADGCRDGDANAHWLGAQREVLATSVGTSARVTVEDTQVATKAEKKSARKMAAKGKRRAA